MSGRSGNLGARGQTPVLFALGTVFFLFAVLLNSVGPVILQSILSFGILKSQAALIEGIKDLSIAFSSFFVSLFLPRLGYRVGIALSLLAVAVACAAIPLVGRFWIVELQFLIVGIAFAIVKTAVYVIIGIATQTPKDHASVTSILEGVFMLGVLSSFWLFSAFIDPRDTASKHWLQVYWCLAAACTFSATLIFATPLDERLASENAPPLRVLLLAMPRLAPVPLVTAFLVCAFLDVLVEQSINTWLPMFNREVLNLSPKTAVQVASLYAAGVAVGRLGAGIILKRVAWVWVVVGGLGLAGTVLGVLSPLMTPSPGHGAAEGGIPAIAFMVPAVGLLLAPIYPVLCSAVLSALPLASQSTMTGLILISSALGGTIGSFVTGRVFAALNGRIAFAGIVAPMLALLVGAVIFDRTLKRARPA